MGRRGPEVVQAVSLAVGPGEVLGVVGESGSGKTTLGLSVLGHTRRGLEITEGSVWFDDVDLRQLRAKALHKLHGAALAYVPQDPAMALNPARKVGPQLLDSLTAHGLTVREARERSVELLGEVGLDTTKDILARYPHQLSGGQLQRIVIAMAFGCRPSVLVLDEPTTGLDVSTQRRVLRTIVAMCSNSKVAAVYISHDIAVVAELAHRIAVLYAGRVVELGAAEVVLTSPQHPYTRRLLMAVPSMTSRSMLEGIGGAPPRPGHRPPGCAFAPRCEHRIAECEAHLPDLAGVGGRGHLARCIRLGPTAKSPITPTSASDPRRAWGAHAAGAQAPELHGEALGAERLSAWYGEHQVLFEVDISIAQGRCLAVVGESGSGKTTLARCLVGAHSNWTGAVRCMGAPVAPSIRGRSKEQLRQAQYIFQNPYASLNPRRTIGALIAQPLRHFDDRARVDTDKLVRAAVEAVALPLAVMSRYPDELSGGERQRVAIARALIVSPAVLICDEVTSSLDVSVQAAVVTMLRDALRERRMAMVFITHDLALARYVADDVLVLHNGRCVDAGPIDAVISHPRDEYTAQLLADVPSVHRHQLDSHAASGQLVGPAPESP